MLHSAAHPFGLNQLGGIQQGGEVPRITIRLPDVVEDFFVPCPVFLVGFHHIREDIPVLRQRKRLHRLKRRERLQAELRHVTRV
ncbi:hypothetical protein D3C76_1644420 [compost metagenome]